MSRPAAGPRRTPPASPKRAPSPAGPARSAPGPARSAPGPAGGGPSARAEPPADPFDPGPVYLGLAYAFGLVLGVILGVYGTFGVPAGPRPGGFLLSYGVALALVGNTGAALALRWWTGTRLGAMTILVGWAPVVVWLGTSRPEGDLVLQGDSKGYLFLACGAIAPIAVAVLGQTRRGLTGLAG